MDRLEVLRVYLAVVDGGSFVGAARTLRLSPPGVTRAIAALELRLGVKLLDRSSRRCQPTEAGRGFAEDARRALAAYDEAVVGVGAAATLVGGSVRITAPLVFGREHVVPLVLDLTAAHSGVDVDLDLSDSRRDLVGEGFDLAVRIGEVGGRGLMVRTVGSVHEVAVASAAYVATNGAPAGIRGLAAHRVIGHGPSSNRRGGRTARLATNSADAAMAFASAGHGIAFALSYQTRPKERTGELVRLFAREDRPDAVRLVWPEGRQRLPRVRSAIDLFAARLGEQDFA